LLIKGYSWRRLSRCPAFLEAGTSVHPGTQIRLQLLNRWILQ